MPPKEVTPGLPATWQSKNYDGTLIEVIVGDMTTFQVDAIVNAANTFLHGGGRINRLIHEAAGPGLLAELSRLYPGEPAGEVGYAYPTRAHNIQTAQYIIHAIGPFYNAGREEQARMDLHAAYYNSMGQAMALGARTIAFPVISTGAYGVPNDLASMIAMEAVREFLDREADCFFQRVVFLIPPKNNHEDLDAYNDNFGDSWSCPEDRDDVQTEVGQEKNGEGRGGNYGEENNGHENGHEGGQDDGQQNDAENGDGNRGQEQGRPGEDPSDSEPDSNAGGGNSPPRSSHHSSNENSLDREHTASDYGYDNESNNEDSDENGHVAVSVVLGLENTRDPSPVDIILSDREVDGTSTGEDSYFAASGTPRGVSHEERDPVVQEPEGEDPEELEPEHTDAMLTIFSSGHPSSDGSEGAAPAPLLVPAPLQTAPASARAGSCGANGGVTKAGEPCKRLLGRGQPRCFQH